MCAGPNRNLGIQTEKTLQEETVVGKSQEDTEGKVQ